MQKSDLLDVGLRLFGVWLIILGFQESFAVIDIASGLYKPPYRSLGSYIWQTFGYLGFGTLLISYAHCVVQMIYGDRETINSST